MKNYIVRPLISKAGIQRDGTPYASQSYIDGQWCRFYMGRPRKIGGYKLIDIGNNEIIRSLFGVNKPNSLNVYLGRQSTLRYNNFDFNGVGSGEVDRTPVGYVPNVNNIWDMDLFTTAAPDLASFIVASAIPNGDDISNVENGNVYYGNINDNLPLVQIIGTDSNPVQVSGGVVFCSPVMIAYGNDGFIRWSKPGDITMWDPTDNTLISNTKIIQMYRTLGGANPQLLVWTLGSVIRVTYIPDSGSGTFSYSTIREDISVMSPESIIQHEQQFFWIGTNQFYLFNGLVVTLPNSMSTDFFFQNINLQQRSKVFGVVVGFSDYKELWWFYPRNIPGQPPQEECNAVIMYNPAANVWSDSLISRAAGLEAGIFPFPLMSDSKLESVPSGRGVVNNYGLWMHEYGFDKVISDIPYAINSFFETHMMTLFDENPENNRLLRTRRIEPDFKQIGNMTVTVNNRMFPSDTVENGQIIQVGPITFNGDTQKIDTVACQGRLVSYVFTSNEVGGTYQAGQTLIDYEFGDMKPGSNV
jgi:hypothetical protein